MAVTAMAVVVPAGGQRMVRRRTAKRRRRRRAAVALCRGAAASRAIRPVNTHASTEKPRA